MTTVHKTFFAIAIASFATAGAQAVFVVGYDDVADPAYASGWANGSNGGYGFGPWFQSSLGTFGIGDSNQNGALGGPGINIGVRAWRAALNPGWTGATAGRSIGSFGIGDVFEIDIDPGATTAPGQGVSVFDGTDFVQVRVAGATSGPVEIETGAGTTITSIAYSDGGYRVAFARTGPTTLDVTVLTLASSSSVTTSVTYAPANLMHDLSLLTSNYRVGQELYANRMRMTSPVPEPASMLALGVALGGLAVQRRRAMSK